MALDLLLFFHQLLPVSAERRHTRATFTSFSKFSSMYNITSVKGIDLKSYLAF